MVVRGKRVILGVGPRVLCYLQVSVPKGDVGRGRVDQNRFKDRGRVMVEVDPVLCPEDGSFMFINW